MNGVDPDVPEVVWDDAAAQLRRALALLHKLLDEEGILLTETEVPRPSLAAARWKKLAIDYATSLMALRPSLDGADLEAVTRGATTVGSKLARIAVHLEGPAAEELFSWDVVPNLLLIEKLDRELAAIVDRAMNLTTPGADQYRRARKDVLRFTKPLLEAVPEAARTTLAALVPKRSAPSPFCVAAPITGTS
jgi:hypothetical protein